MVIHDEIKNIKLIELFSRAGYSEQKVSNDREEAKTERDNRKEGDGPKQVKETSSNIPRQNNVGVRFEVEGSLHMVVAKIIDKESGEVIRQIPPDERIKLAQAIKDIDREKGSGVLIDTEA